MAQFPHLLASCTRHRLTEAVAAVRSGWRQLEEDLYRSHAQNLPEKVYLPQRIFKRKDGAKKWKNVTETGAWYMGQTSEHLPARFFLDR